MNDENLKILKPLAMALLSMSIIKESQTQHTHHIPSIDYIHKQIIIERLIYAMERVVGPKS